MPAAEPLIYRRKLTGYLSCAMIGLIAGCVLLAGWITMIEGRLEYVGIDHRELPVFEAWGWSVRTLLAVGLTWPIGAAGVAMLAGGRRAGPGLNRFSNALLLSALGVLTAAAVAVYLLATMLEWWSPYLRG